MTDHQRPDRQVNDAEGADPADDIRKQNPGETTTQDLVDANEKKETGDGR
jgi:hypothetical protein